MHKFDPNAKEPETGKTRVLMSAAFLKAEEEKEHYGLYRAVVLEWRDDKDGVMKKEDTGKHLGPLAIFRIAREDEEVHMRTIHPETQQEMKLHKVWEARDSR